MNDTDSKLHQLLKAAAQAKIEEPASVPFGFDTRIVALWRAGTGNGASNGVIRLVRRVAILSAAVILLSSAASFYEFRATRDIIEPGANEFAIADSAIQSEFEQ